MNSFRSKDPLWFKSSHSSGDGTSCVEVADLTPRVGVRDSKDRTRAAVTVSRPAWGAFVRGLVGD